MPAMRIAAQHQSPLRLVNDIHSRLNATTVDRIVDVHSVRDGRDAILLAKWSGQPVCIAGGRHSMGGQQFAEGAVLLDTRRFNHVIAFDRERGTIEVEAGMQWPELLAYLAAAQRGTAMQWTIAQKQTGADRLSIGGAVSSNVHGRGLAMRPFISDIECLTLIDADGRLVRCSRSQRPELFRLVVGGYGLFGFIVSVTLRLVPRRKLMRVVDIVTTDRLMEAFESRIGAGFLYGDLQFEIDAKSPGFLRRGVFSTYRPVPDATPIADDQRSLSVDDWKELLVLAHTDKSRAFDLYTSHYIATDGQLYWSDLHQLGAYIDDYHVALDAHLGAKHAASEVIGELYVPRERLADFMAQAAEDFRRHDVDVIYGTIRLIERDDESFLNWARNRYACVIFNLHTEHTAAGRAHTADAFRRLIDFAIARNGSYYLTYARDARPDQVLSCYPQFPEFLRRKLAFDPDEHFQSEWYRFFKTMFADRASDHERLGGAA